MKVRIISGRFTKYLSTCTTVELKDELRCHVTRELQPATTTSRVEDFLAASKLATERDIILISVESVEKVWT